MFKISDSYYIVQHNLYMYTIYNDKNTFYNQNARQPQMFNLFQPLPAFKDMKTDNRIRN